MPHTTGIGCDGQSLLISNNVTVTHYKLTLTSHIFRNVTNIKTNYFYKVIVIKHYTLREYVAEDR